MDCYSTTSTTTTTYLTSDENKSTSLLKKIFDKSLFKPNFEGDIIKALSSNADIVNLINSSSEEQGKHIIKHSANYINWKLKTAIGYYNSACDKKCIPHTYHSEKVINIINNYIKNNMNDIIQYASNAARQ